MTSQHSHNTTPFRSKKNSIVLVSDGVQSPANIGGLFRICEAFGISNIVFGGTTIDVTSARIKKTARETHLKIPFTVVENINASVKLLKKDGYRIIALEITKLSNPIQELSRSDLKKIVLIVGNEQNGISEETLKIASQVVHIEMFGSNSSMNVVQATGIALFSLTSC